jgi:hypothetical protein
MALNGIATNPEIARRRRRQLALGIGGVALLVGLMFAPAFWARHATFGIGSDESRVHPVEVVGLQARTNAAPHAMSPLPPLTFSGATARIPNSPEFIVASALYEEPAFEVYVEPLPDIDASTQPIVRRPLANALAFDHSHGSRADDGAASTGSAIYGSSSVSSGLGRAPHIELNTRSSANPNPETRPGMVFITNGSSDVAPYPSADGSTLLADSNGISNTLGSLSVQADVDVASAPEPTSLLLLGSGLVVMARKLRKRQR